MEIKWENQVRIKLCGYSPLVFGDHSKLDLCGIG